MSFRWGLRRLPSEGALQLQSLIDHAAKTVPFYRDRLGAIARLPPGKLTPTFLTEPILNELPVRQFQLVQKTVHEIEARLAVKRPLSVDEEARLPAGSRSEGRAYKG